MDQRAGGAPNNGNVGARSRLSEGAEHTLDEWRGRMGDLGDRVVGFIRERPGTAILVALGAGYLIGRMLRS
jgi:hypothetical protein